MRRQGRVWPLVLVALVIGVASVAFTNANTVPTGRADDESQTITPNNLKPTECVSISLTAKISGAGNITGTGATELITGGPAAQTINGGAGADCILGGDGNDAINGGTGGDICIGGGGTDTFTSCATSYQ